MRPAIRNVQKIYYERTSADHPNRSQRFGKNATTGINGDVRILIPIKIVISKPDPCSLVAK